MLARYTLATPFAQALAGLVIPIGVIISRARRGGAAGSGREVGLGPAGSPERPWPAVVPDGLAAGNALAAASRKVVAAQSS
jgi:hypothetical protein